MEYAVLAFYPKTLATVTHKRTTDSAEAFSVAKSLSEMMTPGPVCDQPHIAVCIAESGWICFRFYGGVLIQKGATRLEGAAA
jgi:hypothetical protein